MNKFTNQQQTGFILIFAGMALHVALFFVLYPSFHAGVSVLAITPVMIAGWLWGSKAGISAGAISLPANMLLLKLITHGQADWAALLQWPGVLLFPVTLLAGYLSGQISRNTRQQIREEYKRAEKQFQTTLEAIPHGMLIVDSQGRILLVNDHAEQMFGFNSKEMPGIKIEQLVPHHRRVNHINQREGFQQHPQHRKMMGRELTAQRKDGSEFPVEVGLNPMITSQGQNILVSIIDISGRKLAESQRQSLLEIMQAAVETSSLHDYLIRVHHSVKKVISAENTFMVLKNKTTGLFEEVYSVDKYDLPLPPQTETTKSASAYVYRTGRPLLLNQERFDQLVEEGELELIGNDSLSWLGVPLKINGESIGVMVVQDYENAFCYSKREEEFLASIAGQVALAIERKRSEEELRASREHFYELFENVPVGIWELDLSSVRKFLDGLFASGITDLAAYFDSHPEVITHCVELIKIRNVNQAALRFYQVEDKSKLTDKATSPIRVDERSYRVFRDQFLALTGGSTTFETEYETYNMRGELRFIAMRMSLASESGQTWKRVFVAFTDLTERQQAEEQVRRRADEFAMLYDTAHNLAQSQQNLNVVLKVIAARAAALLGTNTAGFYLYDAANENLDLVVKVGEMFPPGEIRLKIGQGASGLAAQTRASVIVNDYTIWENRSSAYDSINIKAVLSVPMLYSGEMIGVLTIGEINDSSRKFTEADTRLLELFASQAAAAIYNAQLLENTIKRLNELEAIARVSTALRAANSLNEMLSSLLDETLKVLGTDSGSIALYDSESGQLQSHIRRGWFESIKQPLQRPVDGMIGFAYSSGEAYHSKNFSQSQSEIPDGWDVVCVPIPTSQEIVGVLSVSAQKTRELTPEEVRLLTILAEVAGNAIHRTRLHEQTKRNLGHISILRQIDQAIASNFDLSVSSTLLVNNAMSQLKADAVCILRLNATTQTLEYFTGRGFYNEDNLKRNRLRLGEKHAGIAALERRQISIANLSDTDQFFSNSEFTRSENIRAYHANPLIAKGEVKGVLEVFHRLPFQPDQEWCDLLETFSGQAALAIDNAELFENLQRSNQDLTFAYDNTIEGWSRALDLRDRETEGHTQRVTEMTMKLASVIGIRTDDLVHIHRGALLHDIGKMGVPDHILLKSGPLTITEWKIMRQHPVYAYQMLEPIAYLRPALEIPYSHHEYWNGNGYPQALKGEGIPLAARIFSIVDVWDALLSNRPYRQAWKKEKVIKYITSLSGKQFDPQVVEVFLSLISKQEI